jgi:MFS family permease
MSRFKRNIKLDYFHTVFRNFNVTQGIWLLFLVSKGFTIIEIGIFEGIFHLASLSMEIPSGIIADLFGRKTSRVLGIVSYLAYVLIMIYSTNVVFIAVSFIFCGMSYAFESGSGEALLYDSLLLTGDEEKFLKISGIKEVLFQASTSIALLIGGYLAIIKYELNFWIVLIVFVVALIPILLMEETIQKSDRKYRSIRELMNEHFLDSTKYVLSDKKLTFLILTGAMMAAPVTTLFLYFQIYLGELNYSLGMIGILLGVHSIFGALGGYFAEKLERKYNERLILFLVPIFIVISFWMIQFDYIIFLPFVLLGFLDSIFYIVLGYYINKLVPSDKRATVLSFNSFGFSIIMIILFPIIGLIGHYVSLRVSFFVLSMIVLAFYILLLIMLRKLKYFEK